jgi:hypothetical protein
MDSQDRSFVLSSSSFNMLSPAAQQEVIRVTIPRYNFDDLPPFDGAGTPPSSAAAAAPRRPAKRTDQPPPDGFGSFGSFGGWWKGPVEATPAPPTPAPPTPAHPSPPKTPHQQRCDLMKSILNNKGLPYTEGIIDNYYAWENDCNPRGNRFQKISEFVRLYCDSQ